MIRLPRHFRFLPLLLLTAACAENNPAASLALAPPPATALAALRCSVSVSAATLACLSVDPGASPGRALIVGGQGVNVRLTSSGNHFDPATGIFRSDVTVVNLTTQMLGTADGYTPSLEGVRVFFASGPDVTQGSGSVEVLGDGVTAFTAAGQSYFQYDGILAPGDTTAAKEWRFSLSSGVVSFVFTVYLSAPVLRERGWISLTPVAPTIQLGGETQLTATVHSAAGRTLGGEPVAWSSSDPDVARVDPSGLVHGVGEGYALITATATDGRSAAVEVVVETGYGPDDNGEFNIRSTPEIESVEVSPTLITANGVDSATVRVSVSTPWLTNTHVEVYLGGTNGPEQIYCDYPEDSSSIFVCNFGYEPRTPPGVRFVDGIEVRTEDVQFPTDRFLWASDLARAGWAASVYVRSSTSPDSTPPALSGFSLSPSTARAGVDTVAIDVTLDDSDTGARLISMEFAGPNGSMWCSSKVLISGTVNHGVHRCRMPVPGYFGDSLRLVGLVARDGNGNVLEMTGREIQDRGFPVVLHVERDTIPPVITEFTLSPSSARANGVDSVIVTATATDVPFGIRTISVYLEGYMPQIHRSCSVTLPSVQPSSTLRCVLRFNPEESGTWRVYSVSARDLVSNWGGLNTAQMQAVRWPTEITVIPWAPETYPGSLRLPRRP